MTLYLEAQVQGYPYPRVTWSHRHNILQNTSNVDADTNLKIRNVTKSQGGLYIISAENPLGNDTFTVNVFVIGEFFPRIPQLRVRGVGYRLIVKKDYKKVILFHDNM